MSYFFSIVITTYNRRELLKKCVASLESQEIDHSLLEVIVVDDGSTDGTREVYEKIKCSFHYNFISIHNGGPPNARNIGAQHAQGAYIVFLEDDVVAQSNWLSQAYKILQSGNLDLLEGTTVYQTSKKSVRSFDDKEYFSFIPCNLFVKKEIFMESGGYDPAFYIKESNLYFRDDSELGFRMISKNISKVKSNEVVVEHPEQFLTIKQCLRHARRYELDPLLYKKHPFAYRNHIDVKNIFGVKLHRVHHYSYLMYLILVICVFLSAFQILPIPISLFLMGIFIGAFLFRFKYQGIRALKIYQIQYLIAFAYLPFLYWYSFLRGCFRFKSFGAIL